MKVRGPLLAGALLLAGCDGGVDLVPLYAQEVYLCTEAMAPELEARVQDCRARFLEDGSCAGVISFTGRIEDEDVTVDTELERTEADYAVFPDASAALDTLSLYGYSPYFEFRIVINMIGGAPEYTGPARTLALGGPTDLEEGWSTDLFTRVALRVAAPPDSQDYALSRGEVTITLQDEDEHAGTFTLERGTSESITGCFHSFTSETQFDPQGTP